MFILLIQGLGEASSTCNVAQAQLLAENPAGYPWANFQFVPQWVRLQVPLLTLSVSVLFLEQRRPGPIFIPNEASSACCWLR